MGLALMVEDVATLPEAVRTLYKAVEGKAGFHLDVDGLEDTAGLKSALSTERATAKAAKKVADEALTNLKRFDGIDPEKTRALLSKFNDEEEAALIASGKVDEVINKRLSKREAEFNKQLAAAQGTAEAATGTANKFKTRVLDNHVRAAAAKAGIHAAAIDDALLRARSIFALNEEGDAVQLGSDGAPVLGKDGKTPFTPSEWLESMKDAAPHWFPSGNSGGGAAGDKGGKSGGTVMKRTEFSRLSPAEQAKTVKTHTIVD